MRTVIGANRKEGLTTMKSICSLGAALGAALFATTALAQAPGDKPAPANTPVPGAAPAVVPPDGGLGVAILGASVSSSATVLFGAGATGAIKLGTGIYEVDFNRDVSKCFYSAASFTNTVPIFVEPRSGNVKGVFLEFFTLTNTAADSQFYLTVYCAN
jgi:hypothetical protein